MSIYQFYDVKESTPAAYFGDYHGVIISGPWNMPVQVMSVPGVYGVSHLIDATKERRLSCYLRCQGFASYEALELAMTAFDAVNGVLTGRVFLEGYINGSYPKCTFMGYERGEIKWDGSGLNGWWVEGQLTWIQRTQ